MEDQPEASNRHQIWTLGDIAQLPADARARLMKELPDIIESIAAWIETLEKMAAQKPGDQRAAFMEANMAKMPGMVTWVDDGRKGENITVTQHDEDGNVASVIRGSSRTRDIQFLHDGEDKTYDAMLVYSMRRLGIEITEDNYQAIIPEGQVVLDDAMLTAIEGRITPDSFADLAYGADRKIIIHSANMANHHPAWATHADIQ